MLLPKRDTEHHTYADYLTWSDDQRYELIDGTAYVREPAPTRLHQKLVVRMAHQVLEVIEGTSSDVYVAPFDVRLPKVGEADDQIDTVVQPDVLIVRDLHKLDDRGMCGAPDWIAKVLSLSTARHDQTLKRAAYERAGVRELWLIHPINRKLAIYRLEDGRYGPATILELTGKTPIAAVPGVTIDWDRLLINAT